MEKTKTCPSTDMTGETIKNILFENFPRIQVYDQHCPKLEARYRYRLCTFLQSISSSNINQSTESDYRNPLSQTVLRTKKVKVNGSDVDPKPEPDLEPRDP
jgi:hypothetical protein